MPTTTIPTDVLLQSRQAKSYLFDRCTLLGVDPFNVAGNAGVSRERFTDWVNAISEEDLLGTITPLEAMTIFESLGVMPRVSFVVIPIEDLDPDQKRIINEIKNRK